MAIQINSCGAGGIRLWQAPDQPDILGKDGSFGNIEWTSDEIYHHLYDPLEKIYPWKIRKVYLGKDTSGTYSMYAWELVPEQYEKTVFLQAGVHAIETEGYFALARMIHLICEGADERLRYLRDNVRFLIVPMVSVWGISRKGSYAQIMSPERYQKCMHNVLGINSNRDFWECRLQETVNVRNYFDSHASEIDFMFDFHTTTRSDWGGYLLPFPDGLDVRFAVKLVQVSSMLYQKNCAGLVPVAFMGNDGNYPTSPITSSFSTGFHRQYQIPSSTLEHSDYVFDDVLGTSVCMTRAVELYTNHLLAFLEC